MPSLAEFCPRLRGQGSCLDPACRYAHILHTCKVCSFTTTLEGDLRVHFSGNSHKKRAQGLTFVYSCQVCDRFLQGIDSWKSHSGGAAHLRRCKEQGITPGSISPQVVDQAPGYAPCLSCNLLIHNNEFSNHNKRPVHKKNEEWATLRRALESAEKDRKGVSVAGDFDFDFVSFANASAGSVAKAGKVILTDPTAQVTLVSIMISSAKGKHNSSFKLAPVKTGQLLTAQSPVLFSISLKQVYVGRCDDRVELVFKDRKSGTQFVIARPLYGIVGSKADHERLKPTTPYRPPSKASRLPETKVINGIPPPSLNAIRYVTRMPAANIPAELKSALSTGTVGQILGRMKKDFLPKELNNQTHGQHFKYLVWIEEFRQEEDMGVYDMSNAKLTSCNVAFRLKVPGLAEKRPSVLTGDRILVQPKDAPSGTWFEGFVHAVELDSVLLHFNQAFRKGWSNNRLFNIRFKLNRHTIRRELYALSCPFSDDRVLFPSKQHLPPGPSSYPKATEHPLTFVNPNIATNPRQAQAVVSIVNQARGSLPFIIFGPPGTGKTVTMVEAIRQVLLKDPYAKILACAPSNSAADLLAERLQSLGKQSLFRFFAPSRQKVQVPTGLLAYTRLTQAGHFTAPPVEELKGYKVVVTTCASSSFAAGIGVRPGHFGHIFIDEAGQASEPEVMISIKTLIDAQTNIVLSGDPKQLGPVIRSAVARKLGMEESYLERLMKQEPYDIRQYYGATVVKLVKNFRSHNAILQFPNDRFYEGELEPCGEKKIINAFINSAYLSKTRSNFPVIFHGIRGKDQREASSPSFFNVGEISLVKEYIERLRADGKTFDITDKDIGVITPYYAQSRKLRKDLQPFAPNIKVGSVEEFQGQERRVIIISTVRSSQEFIEYDLKHTLGFVASPRRFNVAVTRAQSLLIIIGDPTVLSLDPLWRSFLNYIHNNKGWIGCPITWDPNLPVDEAGGYDQQIREAATADMSDLTRRIEELTLANVEDGHANIDRPWNATE